MRKLLIIILFLLSPQASADILLLVHGYLGGAGSWEKSGIIKTLSLYDWKYQGRLVSAQPGLVLSTNQETFPSPEKSIYAVELPFKAPLDVQADMLQDILNSLAYSHVNEPVTLVGHSAGGLVARVALVKYGKGNVNRLITIATPHLGTPRAAQALDAVKGSGPFGMVKSFFGGEDYRLVQSSKQLLRELLPPRPNNYLYKLGLLPHPELEYVSIVRTTLSGRAGDELVPGYSQDMNNIPALAGRSFVYYTASVHQLVPKDGVLLSTILERVSNNSDTNKKRESTFKLDF